MGVVLIGCGLFSMRRLHRCEFLMSPRTEVMMELFEKVAFFGAFS